MTNFKLWRIRGEASHGPFSLRVRAEDHASALRQVPRLWKALDCVLIEEMRAPIPAPPAKQARGEP